MKTALALILFAVSAFAQDSSVAAAQSACDSNHTQFRIKTNNNEHPLAQPDPAKALVHVIEDQEFKAVRDVTARVGLEGAWVGANHGNSYLSFIS
jgi:hypothetical protein